MRLLAYTLLLITIVNVTIRIYVTALECTLERTKLAVFDNGRTPVIKPRNGTKSQLLGIVQHNSGSSNRVAAGLLSVGILVEVIDEVVQKRTRIKGK